MNKLLVIGEALIDFIPNVKGSELKDVVEFKKVAGGAPANVAGCVAKLGGKAKFLTKLGNDAFGMHIVDELKKCNVDTDSIILSDEYDTSLAFVSLKNDGNRDFKFYRKTAADLFLKDEEVDLSILDDIKMIHFCSVDLVESPMKKVHLKLLNEAVKRGIVVSFDPNLRFALWDNAYKLKETVLEFINYADILKISDEELEFITGTTDIDKAKEFVFNKGCKLFIYTMGKDGAYILTKDFKIYQNGLKVNVLDTTGAGDSFIGSFLYNILKTDKNINDLSYEELNEFLKFSNLYAAYITTKAGSLGAMANLKEIEDFKINLENK